MTRKILYIAPITALALLCSCHSAEHRRISHEAKDNAILAAEKIIAIDSVQPVDSAKLEYAVIEARATQFEYEESGVKGAGEQFSSTLRDIITARRPELAAQLFTEQKK